MMRKHGFTLVELLVVIVIIGVLSVVIIPSLIKINDGINERLLSEKIENIESAAQLYARNNEEIFNGTTMVKVYVYQLVETNYLTVDIKDGSSNCETSDDKGSTNKGCVQNPVSKNSMNKDYVELTRNGTGFRAEYISSEKPDEEYTATTLVQAVCVGFKKGTYIGQTYDSSNKIVRCECDDWNNPTKLVLSNNKNVEVSACIIAGDSPQNYLRYGGSVTDPNWRVLGLYKLDEGLSAKLITIGPVKE